jgi:hypothetical protein
MVLKIYKKTPYLVSPKDYCMKDYIPVACFRNHETILQSSVEVTKFFTSNGSARAVRYNLWFVSVGSTCSPDRLHTTDVMKSRKDSDHVRCHDGTFYRLQGSCADPQNSELRVLYIMWDICESMNSVMLLFSLLFLKRWCTKGCISAILPQFFLVSFLQHFVLFLMSCWNAFSLRDFRLPLRSKWETRSSG